MALTSKSSSLISELTVKCKVKALGIAHNRTIGEDQQLYSMLTNPSTELEVLHHVVYQVIKQRSKSTLH